MGKKQRVREERTEEQELRLEKDEVEVIEEKKPTVRKEPVLSTLSGMMVLLVTFLCDLAVSRYALHKLDAVAVSGSYLFYDTVLTAVVSAGLIVLLNYVRVTDAFEKAESEEDFPCGGPFFFLAGNPFVLWVELAVLSGLVFTGISYGLFALLGAESWEIWQFFLYKAIYCFIMTFLVHWMALGRFLQPDWIRKGLQIKQGTKPKVAPRR